MDIDIKEILEKAFPPINGKKPKMESFAEAAMHTKLENVKDYGTLNEFVDHNSFLRKCTEHKQKEEEGSLPFKLNPSMKPITKGNKGEKACTIIITVRKKDLTSTESHKEKSYSGESGPKVVDTDYKKIMLDENMESQRKAYAKMLVDEVFQDVLAKSKSVGLFSHEQRLAKEMKDASRECYDKGDNLIRLH